MWNEYKKRFAATQIFVAIGLVVAWQVLKVQPQQLIGVFIAMELGGIMGAWLGARMKTSLGNDDELPPLSRD